MESMIGWDYHKRERQGRGYYDNGVPLDDNLDVIGVVRRLNDTICIENGYSIVENPKPHGKGYNKWLGDRAKPAQRETLRVMIGQTLEQNSADFDALLKLLEGMGCEVPRRGKFYRLKAPGWKNAACMLCLKNRSCTMGQDMPS